MHGKFYHCWWFGFFGLGAKSELKFALEKYWKGESSRDELKAVGARLRERHWNDQAALDFVSVEWGLERAGRRGSCMSE